MKDLKVSDFSSFTIAFMTMLSSIELKCKKINKILMNEEAYTKFRIQRYSEFNPESFTYENKTIEIDEKVGFMIFLLDDEKEIKLLK